MAQHPQPQQGAGQSLTQGSQCVHLCPGGVRAEGVSGTSRGWESQLSGKVGEGKCRDPRMAPAPCMLSPRRGGPCLQRGPQRTASCPPYSLCSSVSQLQQPAQGGLHLLHGQGQRHLPPCRRGTTGALTVPPQPTPSTQSPLSTRGPSKGRPGSGQRASATGTVQGSRRSLAAL